MFWRQSKILACLTSLQKNQKRMAVTKEPGIFSYSLSLPGGSVVLGSRWIGSSSSSSSSSSLRIKRPLKPQTRDSKPQTPKQIGKRKPKRSEGHRRERGIAQRPPIPHLHITGTPYSLQQVMAPFRNTKVATTKTRNHLATEERSKALELEQGMTPSF